MLNVLSQCVRRLDAHLRRWQGVHEFTTDPNCILRIAITQVPWEVTLPDETLVRHGDRVVELHFWNERLPVIPQKGPDLQWGSSIKWRTVHSLMLLAQHVRDNPQLRAIKAFRMRMALFGAHETRRMNKLCEHLGFVLLSPRRSVSRLHRLHAMGENVLLWAFIRTFNSGAERFKPWRRSRYELWLSREMLFRQYCPDCERVAG